MAKRFHSRRSSPGSAEHFPRNPRRRVNQDFPSIARLSIEYWTLNLANLLLAALSLHRSLSCEGNSYDPMRFPALYGKIYGGFYVHLADTRP